MEQIIWSIKEIKEILCKRQENKFDANFAVSGSRGDGKSTLIGKIFFRFPEFKPWKHIVYSRDDVMHLLKNQKLSLCWDDEAINTAYKREFQNKAQHELIKIITSHRDNFNILASAIPSFYSLDRDMRDLYFMHIHIVERETAIIHMPTKGKLYSEDRWDTKFNQKIEERWAKARKKNPKFKIPYHQLSTFKGYLFFKDLTVNQRTLCEEIKGTKREEAFKTTKEKAGESQLSFSEKLYKLLMEGKLSSEGMLQACLMEGKKYSVASSGLNQMLKDRGEKGTLKAYLLQKEKEGFHNRDAGQINAIVPDL